MAAPIFFGNRRKFVPIPAPMTDAGANDVGYTSLLQFGNGGAAVHDSLDSHREFSWNFAGQPEGLRIVQEFQQGVHGPGPFYTTDIFAMDSNLFRAEFAMPALGELGYKPIVQEDAIVYAANPNTGFNLPYRMARITSKPGMTTRQFAIMIPPGYELRLGNTGTISSGSGCGLSYRTISPGGAIGLPTTLPPLGPTLSTRYNLTLSGNTYSGVLVSVAPGVSGTLFNLIAMSAILRRIGSTAPLPTTWALGEGVGGLRFQGGLPGVYGTKGGYTVPGRRSLSVKLVETETWES